MGSKACRMAQSKTSKIIFMQNTRVIARLDIKGSNLIKGIHLEGLRVLGEPHDFPPVDPISEIAAKTPHVMDDQRIRSNLARYDLRKHRSHKTIWFRQH